jgi:hypothetical protein
LGQQSIFLNSKTTIKVKNFLYKAFNVSFYEGKPKIFIFEARMVVAIYIFGVTWQLYRAIFYHDFDPFITAIVGLITVPFLSRFAAWIRDYINGLR